MSFTARAEALAKLWLLSFVLIAGLLAPGLGRGDGLPFSRIVVFGDSLSDSGNLFALGPSLGLDAPGEPGNNWSMNTAEELITLVPGQAYVSRRLSNGPTWVELLGTALRRSANVKPVFADPTDFHRFNFAVAGATAANPRGFAPGTPLFLGGQVDVFLARAAVTGTTSDTLYVIAIGGNDIRAIQDVGPGILDQALAGVEQAIRRLNAVGGTRFLIWNIPDVGATPAFQRLQNGVPQLGFPGIPGIAATTTFLVAGYNALLEARLQSLSTELGVDFIQFDAFQELTDVRQHPRRYGLRNAEDPCIQVFPFFPAPGTCAQPDRHLFWDGIHPTRAGHAIIAFLNGKALVHALHD